MNKLGTQRIAIRQTLFDICYYQNTKSDIRNTLTHAIQRAQPNKHDNLITSFYTKKRVERPLVTGRHDVQRQRRCFAIAFCHKLINSLSPLLFSERGCQLYLASA